MRLFTRKPVLALAFCAAALVGGGTIGLKLVSDPADAAAPSVAEPVRPADCDARLSEARAAMAETAGRLGALASAGTAERCEAYRAHLTHVTAAGEAFSMCAVGFQGEEMSRQAELSRANWQGVVDETCAAP